ncbi:DUF6603 domain-containing protein [Embleya sp. NPDC020630]|uniref:DUF6603 domain-containing protein n=1 Tax=Embleya sp. NPDC020630 TaxID=3363979 RepID=UPI00379A5080
MGGEVWGDLPVDLVPTLTSGYLTLEIPSGGGKFSFGMALVGTEAKQEWRVGVASACETNGDRVTVVAAGLTPSMSLADLPVVGPQIPREAARVSQLSLVVRTAKKPSSTLAARLATLLQGPDAKGAPLDAKAFDARAALGAQLVVDSRPSTVWMEFGGTPPAPPPPALRGAEDGSDESGPDTAPSDGSGIVVPAGGDTGGGSGGSPGMPVWMPVDKALGPLQVHRVGLRYDGAAKPKRLCVVVDASLGALGLVFDAVGLGLGLAMDGSYRLTGLLEGLGLSFRAGPARVAGALVRKDPPPSGLTLMIEGMLTVSTPRIGFLAAGMYGQLADGRTTVFVVGQVTGLHLPLGPVDVTGLLGGFGYNSDLTIPAEPRDVPTYPLVAGLADPKTLPVDKGAAEVLAKLDAFIKPAGDHLWITVGVAFTVFEVVEAAAIVAVLVVPGDLTIAVLGTARIRFPQNDNPYVSLTLGLRAVYRMSTGELSVSGALDPAQSYLVSRDCHVQGGFAVCTWVPPSSHVGDFVITFGGYHPAYKPPKHYPQSVDRIGVVWKPADSVVVRGEAYAAVTPSMLQVGGMLRVEYTSSVVSAWLRAEMNAVVQWDPFRFEVDITVQVGADVHFLGTHHFELTVGLTLWGPPTGGIATLELPIIPDIHIKFGAGRPAKPEALAWADVRDRVLAKQKLQARVASGLVHDQGGTAKNDQQEEAAPAMVSLDALSLSVQTPVPCTSLEMRKNKTETAQVPSAEPGPTGGTGTLTVRPMHKRITAGCVLALAATKTPAAPLDLSVWAATRTIGGVPAAVWGPLLDGPGDAPPVQPKYGTGGDPEVIDGQTLGALLVPPPTKPVDILGPMPKENLEYEEGKTGRLAADVVPVGSPASDGTRAKVAATIGTAMAAQARQALVDRWQALGICPGVPAEPPPVDALDTHDGYADRLWSLLESDPMLVPALADKA